MSKFIKTRCGIYLNKNQIVSIDYREQRHKEYDETLGEWYATDINKKEYSLDSFICKRIQQPKEYEKSLLYIESIIGENNADR
jgi:hypothetical protein